MLMERRQMEATYDSPDASGSHGDKSPISPINFLLSSPIPNKKKREFLSPDYRKKKLFAVSRGN